MINIIDPVRNYINVTVSAGYDNLAASIVLGSGLGASLPNPSTEGNYNLIWYNSTDYSDPSKDPNVEIIRVTALATDTLTIQRPTLGNNYNGEGSVNLASTHNIASKVYKLMLGGTKNTIDSINNSLMNVKNQVSTSINYSILTTDHFIDCTGGSGGITVTLPTAINNTGLTFTITKVDGGAGVVTIATTASQNINGNLTKVISLQYVSYSLHSDGANWIVN